MIRYEWNTIIGYSHTPMLGNSQDLISNKNEET